MSARILVVDDVPANVKLLEARLSAEYFDVLTASNGAEALAICARAECDIILLDVMMPDMDGFEVCRRLKSNPATHFIPVVIVTALDSSGRSRARAGGRRRRFPDQAGVRHRADRARALADAAEDDDRRTAHARHHLARDRHAGAGAQRGRRHRARAAASCWSTTGRRPTSGWRRSCPPSTPSTSRPIRRKRCSMPPRAITIC